MRTVPKLCFSISAVLYSYVCLQAQEKLKPKKFEVGTQFTFVALRQGGLVSNEFLLGGRFTFNVYRWLGLDSEWDFTPQQDTITNFVGGRRNQFLFGPKVGIRNQKVGVFAKGRGGITTSSNTIRTIDVSSFTETFGRHTDPVIDLGGVVEVYPGKRWILRYDISDLIVQHNNNLLLINAQNPPGTFQLPHRISHSFQFSTGISDRF